MHGCTTYSLYLGDELGAGEEDITWTRSVTYDFVSGESAGQRTRRCAKRRLKKPSISVQKRHD